MYLSFDIGGTAIKYGIVTDAGEILEKGKVPTPQEENEFLNILTEIFTTYKTNYDLAGIGISAPGVVSKKGVMTTFGALTKLYGMPLADKLSQLTGLSVAVENDANAAAIAEHWTGGAKDLENYLVMVIGTGIGGGLVINGQVYRGGHGMAGELGWPLNHGVLTAGNIEHESETFHSATVLGLLRRYNLAQASFGQTDELTDAKALIDLVKAEDETAQAVFDEFVSDLAVNLLNLFTILDPEAILIGGGISENEFFMQSLIQKWQKLISRHEALDRVNQMGILGEVRKAQLGNDAGILGAAYLIKTKVTK